MNRDRLLPIGLLLLLAMFGLWMASTFEWAHRKVRSPLRGEAASNPLYATHRLVRELGGKAVTPDEGLHNLPPMGSTLYLNSAEWSLFPGRTEKLQQWVDQGGHLVMPSSLASQSGLSEWVPVTEEDIDTQDDDNQAKPERRTDAKTETFTAEELEKDHTPCQWLTERRNAMARFPGKPRFELCAHLRHTVHSDNPVLWSMGGSEGAVILRVKSGAGTITVHSVPSVFDNRRLLLADHALLAAAILQLRPGREVWFLHAESRPGFMTWLWQNAWVAVILSLLAIAAGLWRGLRRFGPRMAPALPVRRSMGEQISGTAQFLQRHGPQALHRATQRALDEEAHRCVRRYATLGLLERAQALATLTGLPQAALAQALQPEVPRSAQLSVSLQLLETARRRLRNNHAAALRHETPAESASPSPSSPPSSPSLSSQGNANADTT